MWARKLFLLREAALSAVVICGCAVAMYWHFGPSPLESHAIESSNPPDDPMSERRLPSAAISISDAPLEGTLGAPVAVVEYLQFDSPAAAHFGLGDVHLIENAYIGKGQAVLAFKPLLSAGSRRSSQAAMAVMCSASQGELMQVEDLLFQHSGHLADDLLRLIPSSAGLEVAAFERCMASEAVSSHLADNAREAMSLGIVTGPTLFVGQQRHGLVTAEARFDVDLTFANIGAAIQTVLDKRGHTIGVLDGSLRR